MKIKQAKEIAQQWVHDEANQMPGFYGAFFHGSTNWLPDDAYLPVSSDLDIMVVFAEPPSVKLGKFIYQGVMLEVSYLPSAEIQSPEQILGLSHLAGSFRSPSIIADPSGQLRKVQAAVAKAYAKCEWVIKRREHARGKILSNLAQVRAPDPFHDQVTAWLFGTGVTTHILLIAGLKNPTVRKRYVETKTLLAKVERLDFYETLLNLLGCTMMSRKQVEGHLAALSQVFDATIPLVRTPFFFASDLSEIARPIAIDGSRALIEAGLHREAIFWIVATYSRCLKVLSHDASVVVQKKFIPGFRELMRDLGIDSFDDLLRRGEEVRDTLPGIEAVADEIMAATGEIDCG